MLQTDPHRRLQAHHLIKDPYVQCEGVRMTAFEMASTIARTNGIRTFKRDVIKLAHNKAVEILVSVCFSSHNVLRGLESQKLQPNRH